MPEAVPTPASDRAIIAFFDVDNTLLRGASLFHLGVGAWRHGVVTFRDIARFAWAQVSFLAVGENRRHLGQIEQRALGLIGGHSEVKLREIAVEIYEQAIQHRLWPESVQLAREHVLKGHEVWLVSATPQIMADVIAERLGLSGALGTRLETEDGTFTGSTVGPVVHGPRKAVVAGELARAKNAVLADCWAYSDSENDIPLLSLVGNRVVVNPDAKLARHARELGWPVLQLRTSSIREARRRVRREAKQVRKRGA